MQTNILFICVHNSARSQMCETYMNTLGKHDGMHCESAGLDAGFINPFVVQAMREDGYDLSDKSTQKVFDVFRKGGIYHYVVKVCAESESALCPIFPGAPVLLNVPFPDPGKLTGRPDEVLQKTIRIRDIIKDKMGVLHAWIVNNERDRRFHNTTVDGSVLNELARQRSPASVWAR